MANNSSNIFVRVILIILVAGAIFFVLDHLFTHRDASTPATAETPVAPAAVPAATTAALTHDQAVQIGTEVGTRVGNEVGERVGKQIAADMLAQRAAAKAAKTGSRKAASSEQLASSPPETTVATVTAPAEATVSKPKHDHKKVASEEETPATPAADTVEAAAPAAETTPPPPSSNVAKPAKSSGANGTAVWWEASLSDDPDALVMRYAGQYSSSDPSAAGIALMFSGRFDGSSDIAGHIKVKGSDGKAIGGDWQPGANPGLLYLRGVPKGRYRVSISAGLKDADGKTLKKDLSGTVTVD